MFSDSFSYWLLNLGITLIWFIVAITSGNYFLAIGAFVYIAIAMLIDLPGTSSEEGSADENKDETSSPFDFLK